MIRGNDYLQAIYKLVVSLTNFYLLLKYGHNEKVLQAITQEQETLKSCNEEIFCSDKTKSVMCTSIAIRS